MHQPHSQHDWPFPYGRSRPEAMRDAPASSSVGGGSTRGSHSSLRAWLQHLQRSKLRPLYEVAVKRNGMTTSLALLGGVLLADTFLYRPSSKHGRHQAVLQTHLSAGAGSSSSSNSSPGSGGGSTAQPRTPPSSGSMRVVGAAAAHA